MFSVSHSAKDEHPEDSDNETKKRYAESLMHDRMQKMKNMKIDVHSIFVQGGVNASRGKGRGKGSGRGGYSKSIASFTTSSLSVPVPEPEKEPIPAKKKKFQLCIQFQ